MALTGPPGTVGKKIVKEKSELSRLAEVRLVCLSALILN